MGWMPDFSYQRNRDSDRDSFKFIKKKKGVGKLGKRLDMAFRPLTRRGFKNKGLICIKIKRI